MINQKILRVAGLSGMLILVLTLILSPVSFGHEAHESAAEEETDLYYFPDDMEAEEESEQSKGVDIIKMAGRFHPVLVHFPIAFLLLAALSEWYYLLRRKQLGRTLGLANLWVGTLSSILAGASGWLLASGKKFSGEDAELLFNHRWLGVSVVILSVVTLGAFYLLRNYKRRDLVHLMLISILAVLVGLAGHFGGSLIYGSDYLTP